MSKPHVYLHHVTKTAYGRIEHWCCHIRDIWASVYGSGHTPREAYFDWLKKEKK